MHGVRAGSTPPLPSKLVLTLPREAPGQAPCREASGHPVAQRIRRTSHGRLPRTLQHKAHSHIVIGVTPYQPPRRTKTDRRFQLPQSMPLARITHLAILHLGSRP